ncbi:MAG: transcription-repair coupling factor [Clostridia bacterium]|nr:transcription-repair coupling factor [Clostridia bacterium]
MSNILTDLIRLDREYGELCELAKRNFKGKSLEIAASGLSGGAADALAISLCRDTEGERTRGGKKSAALCICPEEKQCRELSDEYARFGLRTAFYLSRDLTFYNMTASHEFEHERLMVLSGLLSGEYDVVFTTPHAALGYTIPPSVLGERMIKIDMQTRSEPSDLAERLVAAGYSRTPMVEVAGQFAARGGILDIFSPNAEIKDSEGQIRRGAFPVRIEFFDDEIDRMGVFDSDSQRMLYNITSVSFTPAREVLLGKEEKDRMEKAIRQRFRESHDEKACETLTREVTALTGDLSDVGFADKYISLIYPEKTCLFDYFDEKTLVLVRQTSEVYDRLKADKWHEDESVKELCESGTLAPKYAEYSKNSGALDLFFSENVTVHLNSLSYGLSDKRLSGLFGFRTRQPVSYAEKFNLLCEDIIGYQRGGYKTVLMTENKTSAKNLALMLEDTDFKSAIFDGEGTNPESLSSETVYVVYGKSLAAYELVSPRVAVLTTDDELTRGSAKGKLTTSRKGGRKKRNDAQAILSYAELEVGDIVVHETYGIGRYLGLEKIKIDGVSRDYISIQYAGNDKLCMPVEKLDLVSKYIGAHADDGLVKLSKMGGEAWRRATHKAKGAVREMAKDLIKLYAERMRRPGFSFDPDDAMQKDFEGSFDYSETECQLDAVADIKQDMMRPVPMDRLLCGDVGYGKTEVALRAAYKAVLSGKQVAILVPTTILALQHYQTAISRFRNFAVNVDMLSRFRTPKQIEQSLRRLERGDTDIIIGTHKLLGKDVKFSDLGLLIVDEEQRFGVAQKEKLKQLGNNIDVLTLTATPIPRTLNMAMGGIRDISLLDEAPGDRHPVQTYVLEYDDLIIMDAIKRELRRGGQVFYIHNFVESIDSVAAKISEAIPEARVTVAHGKMDKEYLEDIWSRMLSGDIDVLVCTTIIETGIDVPNANTLIADRADRLGLSQLHQLRGRVGRSSRRAYAYFTYPKGRAISEVSQKRLEAIREYAEFGAGFRIALRDMEIRGAGNILGAEQHGHLEAIGYDLYIKLLNDAVLEEKGEVVKERGDCLISLEHDALIPEKYVRYPGQRMTLYKRIALIRNQYDMDDIADELLDRFGEMPQAVENLLNIALIRATAIDLGIKQITEINGEIRMYQSELDIPMWQEMSFIVGGRLRVVLGTVGDSYVTLKLRQGENSLKIINKMFENYLETVQTNEKNFDEN